MKINFATGNEVEHNEYEIVILQRHIITSETINLFVWRNLNWLSTSWNKSIDKIYTLDGYSN